MIKDYRRLSCLQDSKRNLYRKDHLTADRKCRIKEEQVLITIFLNSINNNIATFFCLGWVARKYPEIIQLISSAGHEIGSHSNSHQLIYRHDRSFFKNDLMAAF